MVSFPEIPRFNPSTPGHALSHQPSLDKALRKGSDFASRGEAGLLQADPYPRWQLSRSLQGQPRNIWACRIFGRPPPFCLLLKGNPQGKPYLGVSLFLGSLLFVWFYGEPNPPRQATKIWVSRDPKNDPRAEVWFLGWLWPEWVKMNRKWSCSIREHSESTTGAGFFECTTLKVSIF